MASANLDYLRRCDSITAGPFVFARFETNPAERPDTRLCWSSQRGYYLFGIVNVCARERDPEEVSKSLVVLSDAGGRILLMNERDSLEGAEWGLACAPNGLRVRSGWPTGRGELQAPDVRGIGPRREPVAIGGQDVALRI
jgi:hypothetical protein